jgi:AcrR family transcriptional regulator
MGDIAAEAGYTVPSLYAYYAGKDQIVEALAARLSSEILSVFDEGFPEGLTTGQRVELLLRRMFSMTESPPRRPGGVPHPADEGPLRRRRAPGRLRGLPPPARPLVPRERAPGPRGRRVADDLAVALLALSEGFLQRWLRSGGRGLLVQQAPLVTDLFLHGALPTIQGRRAAR